METPYSPNERQGHLEYGAELLSSLGALMAGVATPLLMYLLELAATQARYEASIEGKRPSPLVDR